MCCVTALNRTQSPANENRARAALPKRDHLNMSTSLERIAPYHIRPTLIARIQVLYTTPSETSQNFMERQGLDTVMKHHFIVHFQI